MVIGFDASPACAGQTDGRTDRLSSTIKRIVGNEKNLSHRIARTANLLPINSRLHLLIQLSRSSERLLTGIIKMNTNDPRYERINRGPVPPVALNLSLSITVFHNLTR